ncbi:MAG: lipopolysaccharide transport periplasmic protein LptA [Pseudomonadota bacterium]|jgi:lipopolysaccharide export system protein LptA
MIHLRRAILACLLCSSAHLWALQSDRGEPINIEADTAERDESKGTTTYAGAVLMKQGSMKINADKVIIYSTKEKVTHIIATGRPVHYEQKPSEKQALVIAQANTLEYQIQEESLHLIESAFLEQEGTNLSGNRIDYDVKNSVVKAGGESKNRERVRMVINPKVLNTDDKPATKP